jgi:hypothetical protein
MSGETLNGVALKSRDTHVSTSHLPVPCASDEPNAGSCYAALLASRRLDYERCQREALRIARTDRSAWAEATLLPALETLAASLRAAGVPSGVEFVNPWLIRLRIGDARRGDAERWVEVNVVPTPVSVTARVGRIARFFPACNEFPSGEDGGAPNQVEVGAWLETLVAQMFV